ncbi:MAG: response regulator, partial [Myxococcales bacterium]
MIRVLLADDSATVRRHLSGLLSASGEFEVVGQVSSGEEVTTLVQRLRPDVVSLDVFMPGDSAAQTVRRVLAAAPVPIVLVSDAPRDASEVFEALAAGALDFVRKPTAASAQSGARMLDTLRV